MPSIRLSGTTEQFDAIETARLIRRVTGMGLSEALHLIDSLSEGKCVELQIQQSTPILPSEIVSLFAECGLNCEPLDGKSTTEVPTLGDES